MLCFAFAFPDGNFSRKFYLIVQNGVDSVHGKALKKQRCPRFPFLPLPTAAGLRTLRERAFPHDYPALCCENVAFKPSPLEYHT